MGAILYGDSGSEKAMYVDQTIALQDISEFYRSSSGLLAGYQDMGNNKPFWYFVRKYNSRGGGYLSGCSGWNDDCLPVIRLQNQPFHSIEEFERNCELGTEPLGEGDESLDYNQAAKLLTIIFKQLSNQGSDQIVYLTIGKWAGSEIGFVKAALSYYRIVLQVLPKKLQKRISFLVNTAPTKTGLSAYHTQMQFYMPKYQKSYSGPWFDCSEHFDSINKYHPYILEMAMNVCERKENHSLDSFEDCIQLPYSSTHSYPVQAYLDLYVFIKLLDSYEPGFSDSEFEVFCEKIEFIWEKLRAQDSLNADLLLEKIKGYYPSLSDEIQAIESDFQEIEKKEREASYFRDLLLRKKQSLIELSNRMDEYILEQQERYELFEQSLNEANTACENALMDRNFAQNKLNEIQMTLKELKENWNRAKRKRSESKQLVTDLLARGEGVDSYSLSQMASLAFKDFANECISLDSKLEACPRRGTWDDDSFPPKSSQPKNKIFNQQELKHSIRKVMEKQSINSESTTEDIWIEGLCLYFRYCTNLLIGMAPDSKYCHFYFLFDKKNIEFIELIFPMLGALLIVLDKRFPDYLDSAYNQNKLKALHEGRMPEYPQLTMYFILLLCGFLLLNFPNSKRPINNNQIDKRVKRFLPSLRSCIKEVSAFFDSDDNASRCFKKLVSINCLDLERFKLMK